MVPSLCTVIASRFQQAIDRCSYQQCDTMHCRTTCLEAVNVMCMCFSCFFIRHDQKCAYSWFTGPGFVEVCAKLRPLVLPFSASRDGCLSETQDMDASIGSVHDRIQQSCERVSRLFRNVSRIQVQPPRHLRVLAVLIWVLSRNVDLPIVFLQRYPSLQHIVESVQADPELTALMLWEWILDGDIYSTVLACIESLDHPLRRKADTFLMESLLVQSISWQNSRGLTVALPQAVDLYLRLWTHRPLAGATRQWLHRLVWHRNTRRHWGVLLRRNWLLTLTVLPLGRELTRERICDGVHCSSRSTCCHFHCSFPTPPICRLVGSCSN